MHAHGEFTTDMEIRVKKCNKACRLAAIAVTTILIRFDWEMGYPICKTVAVTWLNGPLTRYAKLRVAHAPGRERFPRPPRVRDPDIHHGTCVTHVPWCMPGLLTNGFLWSWWRGKRSRRMRNPQFFVSGKRPVGWVGRRGDVSYYSALSIEILSLSCTNPSRYV